MPSSFHHHHHQHSQSGQHGAAQGIFEAAQTLGSIGAPTGNLRTATLGTTSAGTDALLPSNPNSAVHYSQSSALPPPNVSQPPPDSYALYNDARQSNNITGRMADHSSYQQSPHVQEPASQGNLYNNAPPPASSVPGSLQPGGTGQGRPAPPPSAYTAPTAVPQINTNASQYSLPTRSNTMHSHSHSRSSPSGMDQQKYVI